MLWHHLIIKLTLLNEYKEIFDEVLGLLNNAKAKLSLKDNAAPVFFSQRTVPFALREKVEQEILRLEREGNWKKVTYSEWATPLVPIVKKDGSIRLCGDYKVTLNPQLQVAQHPLPKPEEMLATMGNSIIFSKLDLRQAFNQLEMDKKSQEYCTLNTHLGLFQPRRLPYGVSSSPALWQQQMDRIFCGISGVFCFVDDVLIAGKDEQDHLKKLKAVLNKIKAH